MKRSIACIGQGFVGGSITTVFSERGFDVYVYDKAGKVATGGKVCGKDPYVCRTEIESLVEFCQCTKGFSGVYFVCLPTPMYDDGEADLSIVEGVLDELSSIPGDRIAVVKSTVPPGSTEKWNKKYESTGLRVVFSPEFLTEANALDDMRNQNRIVLGGPRPWINKVRQVFQSAFPNVPIIKTSSTTAEFVKYFTNIQLAARVVLSCELYQICEKLDSSGLNVDFDKVVEYSKYDKRLGDTHMSVPGHDGIAGARGHCFPKDLAALVFLSNKIGVQPKLLEAIQSKNLELVPPEHRDWEKMVGRAFRVRTKNS
jgi:UDPglucose 6-dehydrogenase